jgi:hypothetical protein
MNRLRDDAGDDPASERGLELLRATQPTQPMPDMKRRVWYALQQTRMRSSGAAPGIFGMPGLKAFAMGVTIVSLAGTAGAMMAGRLIVPVLDRAARSDSASGSGARAAGARSVRRAVRGRSTTAPDLAAPSSALAPSAASAQPAAQEPTSARRRRLAMSSGGRVASPIIAPAAPARSEVLEALVALRRDHDPARPPARQDA